MPNVLDLTNLQQPTLDLTMPDGTKLRVTIPGTDMVRDFQAAKSDMNALLSSGTEDGVSAAYELVARILSYNMEGIAYTAEGLLADKRINLYTIIAIYKAYIEFIHDIEKN